MSKTNSYIGQAWDKATVEDRRKIMGHYWLTEKSLSKNEDKLWGELPKNFKNVLQQRMVSTFLESVGVRP